LGSGALPFLQKVAVERLFWGGILMFWLRIEASEESREIFAVCVDGSKWASYNMKVLLVKKHYKCVV
jgi:hypothetical protein